VVKKRNEEYFYCQNLNIYLVCFKGPRNETGPNRLPSYEDLMKNRVYYNNANNIELFTVTNHQFQHHQQPSLVVVNQAFGNAPQPAFW
jgi:hypothetical protein